MTEELVEPQRVVELEPVEHHLEELLHLASAPPYRRISHSCPGYGTDPECLERVAELDVAEDRDLVLLTKHAAL
ncbi:hypothetical protein KIK06_28975 [Nocardiopsis sp. EMB25]|uniref:hypothetical protein n=1 Tax=Nocardiopsis sp. EMB25 TaxID=2835867 RepID=UPI0022849E4F|nr:hypothetical protein [Nocardiopsis sp. EMB25]MCY9787917.1 hypothetical protein [Nocardiopsis sp. EMB25]